MTAGAVEAAAFHWPSREPYALDHVADDAGDAAPPQVHPAGDDGGRGGAGISGDGGRGERAARAGDGRGRRERLVPAGVGGRHAVVDDAAGRGGGVEQRAAGRGGGGGDGGGVDLDERPGGVAAAVDVEADRPLRGAGVPGDPHAGRRRRSPTTKPAGWGRGTGRRRDAAAPQQCPVLVSADVGRGAGVAVGERRQHRARVARGGAGGELVVVGAGVGEQRVGVAVQVVALVRAGADRRRGAEDVVGERAAGHVGGVVGGDAVLEAQERVVVDAVVVAGAVHLQPEIHVPGDVVVHDHVSCEPLSR